jgi:hypothetical protein
MPWITMPQEFAEIRQSPRLQGFQWNLLTLNHPATCALSAERRSYAWASFGSPVIVVHAEYATMATAIEISDSIKLAPNYIYTA